MNRKRGIIRALLVLLLLGIALVLMIYPFIANYIFENRADSIVSTIERKAENTDSAKWKNAVEQAKLYNHVIASGHIQLKDPFIAEELEEAAGEYMGLLCMTEDGVMGFIEIPSISLSLPIYHGTSDQVLEMGAGHLQGTSLPVGGESTHTVLTGHSGLSNARLFTDLTEMEENDIFFLNVMGQKLAYKVDQIKTVLPTELDDLYVIPGKDYCTLITCTPYGVNTHRLLVRGIRTDDMEMRGNSQVFRKKQKESKWMAEYKRAMVISVSIFLLCLVLLFTKRKYDAERKSHSVIQEDERRNISNET